MKMNLDAISKKSGEIIGELMGIAGENETTLGEVIGVYHKFSSQVYGTEFIAYNPEFEDKILELTKNNFETNKIKELQQI